MLQCFEKRNLEKGQALLEIVLATAITVVFFVFISQSLVTSMESDKRAKIRSVGVGLAQEGQEALRSIASENWQQIYGLTKTSQEYYLTISDNRWILTTNAAYKSTAMSGKSYERWIIVDNISRDANGDIEAVYNAANDDPSTQKLTVTVSLPDNYTDIIWPIYLGRWTNRTTRGSDWDGSSGVGGPVTEFSDDYYGISNISTSTDGQITLPLQ